MSKNENISENTAENKIIKTIIEVSEQQTQSLKSEIIELKKILNETKHSQSIDVLKNKCLYLEKQIKKNNIIIFGLDTTTDLVNNTLNTLKDLLAVDICKNDIDDIYAIGRVNIRRPIIVRFISHLKKKEILNNCRRLKGTGVAIAEDLTYEERAKNKILRKHLLQARASNLNAYIKGDKLFVNGEPFTAEELDRGETNDSANISLERRSSSAPATPNIREVNSDQLISSPSGGVPVTAVDLQIGSTPVKSTTKPRSGSVSGAIPPTVTTSIGSGAGRFPSSKQSGPVLRERATSKIGKDKK